MTPIQAAEVLGLDLPSATAAQARAAYRTAAARCHPDAATADPTQWDEVTTAHRVLLKYFQKCPDCAGVGRVKRGLLVVVCRRCNGIGS